MSDVVKPGTVYARHNWGRWIADCPACPSAVALSPGMDTAVCWDCGEKVDPILWPADPDGIETLLSMRPAFVKDDNGSWICPRNWEPGETLNDLLADNVTHGCIPDRWRELAEAAPGGVLEILGTTDGVVTSGLLLDALPAGRPHPAIGA